jgi:uncharacterized protein (DUF1697 family)
VTPLHYAHDWIYAMPHYVTLLRAVSPLELQMPRLRECFQAAEFVDLRTLLSSGHVVFTTRDSSGPN